ncbi:Uma2 family endonuclease [Rubrivirga sp. S365]|uniref:Uma2 family endonuclease n=1 Tax=Rubrivirga litoralis TaxID=3075598 RepID=A0ABU3BLU6_9BACT|nr:MULTISPECIES: Uma2 family endonuclease [unclassified Rubrivirga]MDT0630201.1 Uma2 family endonuclease [Rubrivirga sp. F394]MDT7855712.1 Uma2 family endonuclease [Rubrivirga sp. S365]
MSTVVRPALSASEFFEWEAGQLDKHEFYHGEVFSMAGGTPEHARLAIRAAFQLERALAGGPCQTFSSDLAVELEPGGHYCYPDLTVVCGPVERSEHGPAATNPTVVVEVLSPSTARWDRGGKAEVYRRVPSLQAIVFVATDRQSVEGLARDGERWVLIEPDADRQFLLDALGVSLDVEALYDGMGLSADIPFPESDRDWPGAGSGR